MQEVHGETVVSLDLCGTYSVSHSLPVFADAYNSRVGVRRVAVIVKVYLRAGPFLTLR